MDNVGLFGIKKELQFHVHRYDKSDICNPRKALPRFIVWLAHVIVSWLSTAFWFTILCSQNGIVVNLILHL